MEPLRILHCVVCLNRGGTETLLLNIFKNIDRTKVQFDFLTSLPGELEQEVESLGGRVYHIPFIDTVGPFVYGRNLRIFFASHPEYTIVHSHMDKFSGCVLSAARHQGIPVRIAHSHSTRSERGVLVQLIKWYYGKKIEPNATHCFACSKLAARWMFPTREADVYIIKNGVKIDDFSAGAKHSTRFAVAHVGRFSPAKNHDFLLHVFAELVKIHPDSKLVLAGDGPLRENIQAKVEHAGLSDKVVFLGTCNTIPSVLRAADVFCMPSLFEGFPISLIEAQAAGLPCVASSRITEEAGVTELVHFLPLEAGAGEWARKLLAVRGHECKNSQQKLKQAGYDIAQTSLWLQKFYWKHGREGENTSGHPSD